MLIIIVKCIKTAIAHTDAVTCLLAKDFTLVSGGHDGSIRFWDIRKMQLIYEQPVRHATNL
jgi:WD40 repeat protein